MNTGVVVEIAGPEMLLEYGQVPMSLTVSSRLRLEQIEVELLWYLLLDSG